MQTKSKKPRPASEHSRSATDLRMNFQLYGHLLRRDSDGMLQRKNSLPRNFKLRISADPEEFSPRSDEKHDETTK